MGLLNIGASALSAAYTQIQTVGNNISNANTVGYHRQTVVQSEVGTNSGAGYVGMGVQVDSVQRQYNQFVEQAVFVAQSMASATQARSNQTTSLEQLFADPNSGPGAAMDTLRAALADFSNTPNSSAVRAVVLSSAQGLAQRVQTLNTQLNELAVDTDQQLAASVDRLNTLLSDLASMNTKLGNSGGTPSAMNHLLDQRDVLIGKVNELIRGNAYINPDNTVTMYAGTGESLVSGSNAAQFSIGTDSLGTGQPQLLLRQGPNNVPVGAANVGGGAIAGLLRFRSEDLVSAQTQLGQMAAGVAAAFNAVQAAGVDSNGQPGQPMFQTGSPSASAANDNSGYAEFSATVVDASALQASDYRIDYNGTDFIVTRLSDNQQTTMSTPPQVIDGLRFDQISTGAATGDRFLVRSASRFASEFATTLTSGTQLAGAMAAYPSLGSTNTGHLTQGNFSVAADAGPFVAEAVTLTFNGDGTFNVSGVGTGDPVNVPYTPGQPISYNGWTMTLNGTPAAGDTVNVAATASPATDNRNAKLLYQAVDAASIDGKTFSDAYAEMIANVGARAAGANTAATVAEQSLTSAAAARDNLSGVNLDEEAVRLLQYQQAYQAAAKVIATANTLFDTLLSAVNR